jgi:replicative DNA helicase
MKLDPIINTIKANVEKGTLVLLDYIQRMPSPDDVSESTYMRVKGISDRVLNTAAGTDAVIIAGAQFNRIKKETGTKNADRDTFDDASFRESGDLEQDAHCAIGIGWYEKKKDARFFEVLKVRDGEIPKYPIKITWRGAFQYMANSGEEIRTDKTEADETAPEKPAVVRGGIKGGKTK